MRASMREGKRVSGRAGEIPLDSVPPSLPHSLSLLLSLSCQVILGCLFVSSNIAAADPLYLSRPYDEITLDENNGNVRLKVLPLKLPGRKLPAAEDRKDDLEIELVDRPGERFRVGWNNIAGIRFFEELVLAEAEAHVNAGDFDDAYPYFQFLETRFPATAGLKDAVENYLWAQSGTDFSAGRHDAALALLLELHQRNPQRPALAAALERVTLKLVEQRIVGENYRAARGLIRSLTQRYPDKASVTAPFEQQLREKAAATVTRAREAVAAGKLREAHLTSRQALAICPTIVGGRELVAEIHRQHPVVSIGVTSASGQRARRRVSRLIAPGVFELAGPGEITYRSQLAQIADSEESRQILLRLVTPSPVSADELNRALVAAADPAQSSFDPAWGEMLARVEIRSPQELLIRAHAPLLHAEAWLNIPLPAAAAYRASSNTTDQAIFVRPSSAAAAESSPVEIVEVQYTDSAAALRGLTRGELSLVDRIGPWMLPSLADNKDIVVGRYAFPSVHVLVPNPRRPLASNRTLKRAILYAIDRQSILDRSLLGGPSIAGCGGVSGPFPRGESKNDPRGLAYDGDVPVRPYDPALAMALARLAASETPPRPLVLAHAADEIPRLACQSINRQLIAAGIPVTLREESTPTPAGDWDLRYEELSMHEPLVDVWRLLGPHGIAGPPSPAMLLALRNLQEAGDLATAEARLKQIHVLAAAELPVIPLWQLVDHFAHHTSVKGIGQRPVCLYQDVDRWQVELTLPSE